MNKRIVTFSVLCLILIGGSIFVLQKRARRSITLQKKEEKNKTTEIDFWKNLPELLENAKKRQSSSHYYSLKRDPLRPLPTYEKKSILRKDGLTISSFLLSGILYDGNGSLAIINGKMVKEKGSIAGVKVIKIEEKSVTLTSKMGKIVLKLPKDKLPEEED